MQKRTIKSFVLRAGRVSNRQQQALDSYLKDYELPAIAKTPWNLKTVFGREAKTVVEIGFGMGASLAIMAEQQPETNFIGIEVHKAGLGSLAAMLAEKKLTNVRIVSIDAVEVFSFYLMENSLAGIQIFFPDPWPKKRHHKRRLIQPSFVKLLCNRLQTGGFIHCATDWQDYANHMQSTLSNEPLLKNRAPDGGFSPRPEIRPLTKFEQRGTRLGHEIYDLIYYKE